LFAQVEAEHREQCGDKEKAVKQKDAIIAALGAQLAESQAAITSLEKSSAQHILELEKVQQETVKARKDAAALKEELEKVRVNHEEVLAKRNEAIEAAREETIQEANVQFEQFNEMYRNMRSNFQKASAKVCSVLGSISWNSSRKLFSKPHAYYLFAGTRIRSRTTGC
jgi:chromosome segregation ATPase